MSSKIRSQKKKKTKTKHKTIGEQKLHHFSFPNPSDVTREEMNRIWLTQNRKIKMRVN